MSMSSLRRKRIHFAAVVAVSIGGVRTIGTANGRDYSTITTWGADAGGGDGSDDREGWCYADSDFDESVTIDFTANSIVLTVAAGERHDGTDNSGVRVSESNNNTVLIADVSNVAIRWLEVFASGAPGNASPVGISSTNNLSGVETSKCIVHGFQARDAYNGAKGIDHSHSGSSGSVFNNIVYDIDQPNGSSSAGPTGFVGGGGGLDFLNNTCHNIDDSGGGATGDGFSVYGDLKNCIATDSNNEDYAAGAAPATEDYNISSDGTEAGGNSLQSTSANLFVSTAGGSEDLHLKSGADAIGAGTDLADTPTGVKDDIDANDRDMWAETTWDIGAHQYLMEAGIADDASKDYATITLWEAAILNVSGNSEARGTCYASGDFDESVTIDDATPDSIVLTVAAGERHSGVGDGSGVRILRTGEGPVITVSGGVVPIHTIEWLEIDNNGNAIGAADNGIIYHPGNKDLVVANVIVHDAVEDNRSVAGISHVSGGGGGVYNSIVYDISVAQTNDDVSGILAADVTQILNNTIYNITGQTGGGATAWGINYSDVADMEVKNNIVTDTSGADTNLDYSDSSPSNATTTNNLDSDGTAPGANPQNNKTSANQFVSTAGGSEDLHIKAGADAIDAGVDLGTTPTGVEIDINGRDRDAEGDTWDIGAHELVVAAGGGLNQILGGGLLVA